MVYCFVHIHFSDWRLIVNTNIFEDMKQCRMYCYFRPTELQARGLARTEKATALCLSSQPVRGFFTLCIRHKVFHLNRCHGAAERT